MSSLPWHKFAASNIADDEPPVTSEAPRVAAPVKRGWHVFDARTIAVFRADAKYTTFAVEAREYMISESLAALELRLIPHGFMRVHRGTVVNLAMVTAVHRVGRETALELDPATEQALVLVSRRHAPAVCRALGINRATGRTVAPGVPTTRTRFSTRELTTAVSM